MKNSRLVKFFLLFIILAFISNACSNQDQSNNPNKEEWISLFNGTDLKDWTPKIAGFASGVNHKNVFSVSDSLLQIRYEPTDTFYNQFGHLFFKDKFSHYRLKATYRFVGDQLKGGPAWAFRNNGLMLHCQSPETMKIDQGFPLSLEMQLLGGNGKDERSTGNLCTPNTHVVMGDTLTTDHCINSVSKTYHGDQWVSVEAVVLGDSMIHHIVEGDVVMTYRNPIVDDKESPKNGQAVKDGYISIQAETHAIDFKSIELLNLCGCMDQKAKNYKTYYVKADNSTCKY